MSEMEAKLRQISRIQPTGCRQIEARRYYGGPTPERRRADVKFWTKKAGDAMPRFLLEANLQIFQMLRAERAETEGRK